MCACLSEAQMCIDCQEHCACGGVPAICIDLVDVGLGLGRTWPGVRTCVPCRSRGCSAART